MKMIFLILLPIMFARAASADTPVLPGAITGEERPLRGSMVRYFRADTACAGYLSVPPDTGVHGAVILIHEWNGLVDRIRHVADALAEEGYTALAADLYSGRTGSTREENMALVNETLSDPERLIANLDAAARFLRARENVSGKIATIGWCYGGGVALSYALGGEHHEGTAIFYGRLLVDPEQLKTLDHEIYGTFGRMDSHPSPEQVGAFVEALRAAGVPNDIHIYDPVGHGFWLWVDKDPDTRAAPAAHAWDRLKQYLRRNIGAARPTHRNHRPTSE